MKARTRIQRKVVDLSETTLPNISGYVEAWAYKTCLKKKAFRTKKRMACLECGYVWERDTDKKRCTCPSCRQTLSVEDTLSRTLKQEEYFGVIETLSGFQVNRYFIIRSQHKVNVCSSYEVVEVCQQWLDERGKETIYAMRHKVSYSQDYWTGVFEIRTNNAPSYQYWKANNYNLSPMYIYPKVSLLRKYKRLGVKMALRYISPLDLMKRIPEDNRAESLLKMGQYSLLEYYLYGSYRSRVERYWKSICICQRKGYKVKDASLWLDYLDCLDYLGKDLRNAYYVCPKNLREEHDIYVKKRRRRQEQKTKEERRQKLEAQEAVYQQSDKSVFFGLSFERGHLVVAVLSSVKAIMEEGDKLHHCVYTNEYYAKPNSLLLSASLDGVSIATIELSLESWSVIQCRGERNSHPQHYDDILALLEENIPSMKRKVAG